MHSFVSRWLMFGLLIGWAMTHATVFGQGSGAAQPAGKTLTAIEKIRAGLDKSVTFDFVGQSLTDVLNHFRDKTGVPVNIDHTALLMMGMNVDVGLPNPQVELKAKDEKASAVLRRLLNGYRMTYIIFEDSLLVTSEEMATLRQMRQRVSVNVDDVPLKKAVTDLAKNHGVNLVIDRTLAKDVVDGAVSLQVENTGIETALRLLAEQGGAKAVRMGNVMYITTAAKAKTIREEEPQQLDNPLNPNMPGGVPPIAFGGIGAGIGGIAMPGRAQPAIPMIVPPAIDLPAVVPPEKARPDGPAVPQKVIPLNSTTPVPVPVPPPAADRPPVPVPPIPRRDQ
jgi:type II secretory pathway component GspD/PulD (secretin)